LLTLSGYLIITDSWQNHWSVFLIILFATVPSGAATLYLLTLLLYPIDLTMQTLHDYINYGRLSKLPSHYHDSVGQLMMNVQYAIDKIDLLTRTQDEDCNTDPLTGILNRRAAEERLRQELARARREGNSVLTVMLDIDKFQAINEQFGRRMGDVCLTNVVDITSKSIREGDWMARWGTDEFLIILWNFQHDSPQVVLKRIQQNLLETPMNELLQVNISIGACEITPTIDFDEALLKIEQILAEVKRSGNGEILILS
jgi:diguanylate cyclase (GGDEF)-like protein